MIFLGRLRVQFKVRCGKSCVYEGGFKGHASAYIFTLQHLIIYTIFIIFTRVVRNVFNLIKYA